MTGYALVIPTVGRDSLPALLAALADSSGPPPNEVIIVNDRPGRPLPVPVPPTLAQRCRVVDGPGRGPAAARNVGWRATTAPWIVFLDDDVVPTPTWCDALARDLAGAGPAAGVQGILRVPLPGGLRPTDWERQVSGLATALWITADMAYRRDVLLAVGGFDERFPRAFREDAELALRIRAQGHTLVRGRRVVRHPVRPVGPWVSVDRQRGNADDALLRRLYGHRWRRFAGVPRGRRPWHATTTVAALLWLTGLAAGSRRLALIAGVAWMLTTADFAARRIMPGPRDPAEIAAMLATSVAIPPVATLHWVRGWWAHRGAVPMPAAWAAGEPR